MNNFFNNQKPLNVLFIDNFDSFVFNLVDEFEKRDCRVTVWRNDISTEKLLAIYEQLPEPKLIVLSPGPGTPDTTGCCVELVKKISLKTPVFGVCLGQQIITQACSGQVTRADQIVHGKASSVSVLSSKILFSNMPQIISVGRYHSLICQVDEKIFKISAKYKDITMAIEHQDRPLLGVQFHPESILTPLGGKIIENVINWAIMTTLNNRED